MLLLVLAVVYVGDSGDGNPSYTQTYSDEWGSSMPHGVTEDDWSLVTFIPWTVVYGSPISTLELCPFGLG